MITSHHPWYNASINYVLEGSGILPKQNEFDDDHYIYLCKINAAEINMYHYYSYSEVDDMVIWINNQGQLYVLPINIIEDYTDYDQYRVSLGFILKYLVKY